MIKCHCGANRDDCVDCLKEDLESAEWKLIQIRVALERCKGAEQQYSGFRQNMEATLHANRRLRLDVEAILDKS